MKVVALAVIGSLALAVSALAAPRSIGVGDISSVDDPRPPSTTRFAAGLPDTTFFGDVDVAGLALDGGIWDFEDGSLQGWSSIDVTDIGVFVRRVEAPFIGAITENDGGVSSSASLWFGATDAEAAVGCWPGGLGYSNNWRQRASRTLTYSGSGSPLLEFDYFVDCETQFDYAYVYVEQGGVKSPPLNTSAWANPSTGLGYSGGGFEGTPIGAPFSPAHESLVIDASNFPDGAGDYELIYEFDSDPLYSDGLDSFTAGFFDSQFGPFGVDAISVNGVLVSDFELDDAGWSYEDPAGIGAFMAVDDLASLDAITDACICPLADGSNQFVLHAADLVGGEPHPEGQLERMLSPIVPVVDAPGQNVGVRLSVWEDAGLFSGLAYRVGIHYYPWTCATTGSVGWTIEPAATTYRSVEEATCRSVVEDLSSVHPADIDSARVVIELLAQCDEFVGCLPGSRNQSPYFDNVEAFVFGDREVPPLALGLVFADRFPSINSIAPQHPIDVKSWYDNNRADGNQANANMGDSAVVIAGTDPGTRVFLNFRVYPGPLTDTSDPFFSRYGGDFLMPGGDFATAQMDTAETESGPSASGIYATYLHENDGGVEGSALYKVIADGVLTPGATVEYFFSADLGPGEATVTVPDTTGQFYLEFEALPGYFDTGSEIVAPCALYIDAFNAGAQVPIEEFGLAPYLGTVTGADGVVHNGWDRLDHIGAATNACAPVAREAAGDNGMSKFQSLLYQQIVYNTGSNVDEGLRDGDADLLVTWLTNDDLGRDLVDKGLWLSGDHMAGILSRPGRPDANLLLSGFAGAALVCDTYRDPGCAASAGGDSSSCVRLDPSPGADFGIPFTYSAVSRNGCPDLESFDVIEAVGSGVGNQVYVDQDAAGQPTTEFAAVSNDQFGSALNYGVILDGYSTHFLRRVDGSFSGDECGEDSTAITTRVEDVFAWFGVPTGINACHPPITPSTGEAPAVPAVTRLLPNSPNPFNPRTTVRYELAADADVTVRVFDVTGARVRTLVDDRQAAADYSVVWDGTADDGAAVASGVYWVRMETSSGFRASTKMVVLK